MFAQSLVSRGEEYPRHLTNSMCVDSIPQMVIPRMENLPPSGTTNLGKPCAGQR